MHARLSPHRFPWHAAPMVVPECVRGALNHLKGTLMAHIVLTLAEWRAVAHELQGAHRAVAPAGLNERLQELFQEAPRDWLDQPYAIDLDAACIEAVWAMHANVSNCRLVTNDEHVSVLAAMEIIYKHQHPADDASAASQEHP
jgi:hypothetical protein